MKKDKDLEGLTAAQLRELPLSDLLRSSPGKLAAIRSCSDEEWFAMTRCLLLRSARPFSGRWVRDAFLAIQFVVFSPRLGRALFREKQAEGPVPVPSFGRLLRVIDYLPSKKLRKQLRKLVADDMAEIDDFAAAGRRFLVRWRTGVVYTTCLWYALRSPFLAAVWGLIKRINGA